VYSPDPRNDVRKICNILVDNNFVDVKGNEAVHAETYSVRVNNRPFCDFSYIPFKIYNKLQPITVDGIKVANPFFLMIDYMRMITDPLLSFWRFDKDLKSFRRLVTLQQHFPIKVSTKKIYPSKVSSDVYTATNVIYNFLLGKETMVTVGDYAFNYFLKWSNVKMFNPITITYFEIISTDYVNDFNMLINELQQNQQIGSFITHKEFYPFFQFTGHSVEIYVNEKMICKLYSNSKRCIPFQDVKPIDFTHGTGTAGGADTIGGADTTMRIGTFSIVMMQYMINVVHFYTLNEKLKRSMQELILGQLIEIRNLYFSQSKKSFLDNTIFKDFVIDCVGTAVSAEQIKKNLIKYRKERKQPYVFTYMPQEKMMTSFIHIQMSLEMKLIMLKILNLLNMKMNNMMKLKKKNNKLKMWGVKISLKVVDKRDGER